MNSGYASVLEPNISSPRPHDDSASSGGICILIDNPMNQRLVETAALQLNLGTVVCHPPTIDPLLLTQAELIVADQPVADRLRLLFKSRTDQGDGLSAGLIAVLSPSEPHADSLTDSPADSTAATGAVDTETSPYEGFLTVPQPPAQLATQLGLLLYAHRAFARRYQDALEELHLNRRIFRSVTSGISVANALLPDLPLIYVNPAFEVMTGYTLEEVQGRNCRFLQGDHRDQPAVALLREAIATGHEITVVLKNFRKDGSAFWNELSLSPIRSREGKVTHFVGIQTDVTARVEFEDALRESEKLAAVGRLASSIAHEINNPLESVMNLIYLAKLSDNPTDTRTYLTIADSELQRVKLITTQSLRFFKQSTRPQAVQCNDLIESVLGVYQGRLYNSNVTVQRRERGTRSVICMESEIRQVLNNLVSNAIDAMHGKGGRLLVRTRDAFEPRSGVKGIMMTFADTGYGIDRETLANIYKAFYTTKGIGGTGLGLWISSEIVQRHHGRILVRSCNSGPRTGTIFELFLPCQGIAL
jgi:two-component system sporulation sensor kinase C